MTKTAEKLGDLEIETRQAEERIRTLKFEVANLEKRKLDLINEANGIRLNVEADVAKRISEGREATRKMLSERETFDAQMKELAQRTLELNEVEGRVKKAKEESRNVVEGYKAMQEKLTRFIVMVKRESELL